MATLLSMDVLGAFDTVDTIRLLDVLQKRRIPMWIVRWIWTFITNRSITLVIQGVESSARKVNVGVLQESLLSTILFLFYNADLLDICCSSAARTAAVGFVNDVNVLAYSPTIEGNYRKLKAIY